MHEPKVFVLTLLAVRTDLDGTELTGAAGASTALTVQLSPELAESVGLRDAYKKYPQSDGWFGHQVTVFELSNTIDTDGYRVSFTITESGEPS